MLSEKQLSEIRVHLEQAQNPLFFYDNDADGLCSYLLFRRFIGRGKGVAVRSHPDVDERYAKKAQELNADYIFVLDRPVLGERFFEEINRLQLPIVWIDHHDADNNHYDGVFRYNTTDKSGGSKEESDGENGEPVSCVAYGVVKRKEDLWIALMGCIADHYLPDFKHEFAGMYPEYWISEKFIQKPFDAYYKTEIGKLARVIGFALKDSVTHVVQFQNFLIQCKSPADFFAELEGGKAFAKKYKDITKRYDDLIGKAKKNVGEKLLFFNYGGELSISSDISNELSYLYPKHIIFVAYSSGPITNISLRGKDVRGLINEILPDFENSSGGGHKDAVGARIQTADLERFRAEVEKRVNCV